MKGALLSTLSLLLGCGSHLQHGDRDDLQQLVDGLVKSGKAPGISVAVLRAEEEPIYVNSGFANIKKQQPMNQDTQLAWFSITKLFTAMAVMSLAERDRLDIDKPVKDYLPELSLPEQAAPITARHLLSHSAGLANPIRVLTWFHLADQTGPSPNELTTRALKDYPEVSENPGTKQAYTNIGYLILGLLIEEVSGETFEDYVEQTILAPLEMNKTGFDYSGVEATGYQRPWTFMGIMSRFILDNTLFGENYDGYRSLRRFYLDGAPYGGLIGAVRDMARFASACLNAQQLENAGIISEKTLREMTKPALGKNNDHYSLGLGWHIEKVDGELTLLHSGGGGGFRSELRIYPQRKMAVVVAANETGLDTGTIARFVLSP